MKGEYYETDTEIGLCRFPWNYSQHVKILRKCEPASSSSGGHGTETKPAFTHVLLQLVSLPSAS